jgi:membrane protease YdiL (CAAX protease family)
MLLPLASAAIAVTDPPTTPGLLATPIANTTVIIRDVLTGRGTVGAFLFASAISFLYAGLLLSLAARVFNTEQLVNPSWEPLSLKGLTRRRRGARPKRLPSIDAALALFAVSLLALLYSAPALRDLDFLTTVVISMLLIVAAPALLAAWAARWPWIQTFSLRRPPVLALLGGVMVGVGLVPCINLLYILQNRVWPADREYFAQILQLFLPAVRDHPILTPLTVGALAGLCEELFYRGPIQAALLRKLPVKAAITIGAVLFAAAHMDVHGFPIRLLLGLILGYVVWRGGSIFPAMLLHAAYDATQLGLMAYAIQVEGAAKVTADAANPGATSFDSGFWIQTGIGVVLLLAGARLMRRSMRAPSAVPSAGIPGEG